MDRNTWRLPNGDEIGERSSLHDPEGQRWEVCRIERLPPESIQTTVTISGVGNPERRLNLDEMVGWRVDEFDHVSEE